MECPNCGEPFSEDFGIGDICSSCGREFWEPTEDDYITEDYERFYQYGKLVINLPEGEDWRAAVKDHMEENKFWPNIWFCSDHGNYHLLSLEENN